jgi:hypothetical protein
MNDKKLCITVGKIVSKRRFDTFKIINSPDEHERQKKAIDLLGKGQDTYYAIEHTQLESFPEQIHDSERFSKDLEPLEVELKNKLPKPGYYRFSLNIHKSMRIKKLEEVKLIIKCWIIKNAGKLKIASFQNDPNSILKEKPNGLDFEVTLIREQTLPDLEGGLFLERNIPENYNLNELRNKRIGTALDKKCPKLNKEKKIHSICISILCLELNDKGLGNIGDTSEGIIAAIHKRMNDIPDYILLVDTSSDEINVKIVKEENVEFPNVKNDLVKIHKNDI